MRFQWFGPSMDFRSFMQRCIVGKIGKIVGWLVRPSHITRQIIVSALKLDQFLSQVI